MELSEFRKTITELVKRWKWEILLTVGAILVVYGLLLLIHGITDPPYYLDREPWWFLLYVALGSAIMLLVELMGRE